MKTNKNIYNNILKYENALLMFNKIKKNCKNKEAVYNFKLNLNTNIYNILMLLYKREYHFNKYRIFMIRDPKYRIIMSENICDKLVNHLVSKYILLPCLESKLIDTNVATRIDKGSKYAFDMFLKYVNKLKYQRSEIYILKIDIKKYFYNIDHKTVLDLLKKYIKDKNAINILENIINTTNESYINERIKKLKNDKKNCISKLYISEEEKRKKYNDLTPKSQKSDIILS